jgi:hypothetical protein
MSKNLCLLAAVVMLLPSVSCLDEGRLPDHKTRQISGPVDAGSLPPSWPDGSSPPQACGWAWISEDGGARRVDFCRPACRADADCPHGHACVCREPGCSIKSIRFWKHPGLTEYFCQDRNSPTVAPDEARMVEEKVSDPPTPAAR